MIAFAQVTLGDLLEPYDERLGSDDEPEVLTLTEGNGFVSQRERFKKRLATADTADYKVVRKHDVAFNPYLLWAGAIAQNTQWDEGIISPAYPTFHIKNGIDPRFVDWMIRSEPMLLAYDGIAFGSVPRRRRSTVEDFLSLPVSVPKSKSDQTRIAAILDKADAIRRKRQQALHLTDDFLRSVFLDMFGDPVTNPKGFPVGVIGDLLESTDYGTSKKASTEGGEFPILRMGNITYEGGWDFTDLKYIDLEKKEQPKHLVHKGQLLFNRTNSKELVGKTAVYREDEPMAFAGYLVRGIAKPDADAEYISAYLNSRHGKQVLTQMCKNIVGMANINAREMQTIPVLLPPPEDQQRFGDIARDIQSKRESWRTLDQEADDLFASLQQRAFRGEL